MSKNHKAMDVNMNQKEGLNEDNLVFNTSLFKVPSCKKCCEACNGCKLRYFKKHKLDTNLNI